MDIVQIPPDNILPPTWNSRTNTFDDSKDLVDVDFVNNIKEKGIQSPLKVRVQTDAGKPTGKYVLIFGSRRLAAAKIAKLSHVPCIVTTEGAGDEMKIMDMVDNVVENIQRRDLTTYEQARAFAELRRAGAKAKDIARRTGTNEGHLSTLVTMYEGLDMKIIIKWLEGNPAATMHVLRDIVKLPKGAEQVAAFAEVEKQRTMLTPTAADDEEEEETEEGEEEAEGSNPSPKKTVYKVDKAHFNRLAKALKKTRQPAIALQVARYLVGLDIIIKGVIGGDLAEKSDKK